MNAKQTVEQIVEHLNTAKGEVIKDIENQGKRLNKEQERILFFSEIKTIKKNEFDKRINERKDKFKEEAIPLIKEQIRRSARTETSIPITLEFAQKHQTLSNVLFIDDILSILEEEFPNFKIIRDFDNGVICYINWNSI